MAEGAAPPAPTVDATISRAYLDHAKLAWDSEQRNADRLHHRRQLPLGLAIPLGAIVAAGFARLSPPDASLWSSGIVALATIIAFAALWLPRLPRTRHTGPVLRFAAIGSGLLLEFVILVGGIFDLVSERFVVSATLGLLLGAGGSFLSTFVLSVFELTRPGRENDRSAGTSASRWLLFNEARLDACRRVLTPHEWALFVRVYRATGDLMQKNAGLSRRIRQAQIWFVLALFDLVVAVLFSAQANLAELATRIVR